MNHHWVGGKRAAMKALQKAKVDVTNIGGFFGLKRKKNPLSTNTIDIVALTSRHYNLLNLEGKKCKEKKYSPASERKGNQTIGMERTFFDINDKSKKTEFSEKYERKRIHQNEDGSKYDQQLLEIVEQERKDEKDEERKKWMAELSPGSRLTLMGRGTSYCDDRRGKFKEKEVDDFDPYDSLWNIEKNTGENFAKSEITSNKRYFDEDRDEILEINERQFSEDKRRGLERIRKREYGNGGRNICEFNSYFSEDEDGKIYQKRKERDQDIFDLEIKKWARCKSDKYLKNKEKETNGWKKKRIEDEENLSNSDGLFVFPEKVGEEAFMKEMMNPLFCEWKEKKNLNREEEKTKSIRTSEINTKNDAQSTAFENDREILKDETKSVTTAFEHKFVRESEVIQDSDKNAKDEVMEEERVIYDKNIEETEKIKAQNTKLLEETKEERKKSDFNIDGIQWNDDDLSISVGNKVKQNATEKIGDSSSNSLTTSSSHLEAFEKCVKDTNKESNILSVKILEAHNTDVHTSPAKNNEYKNEQCISAEVQSGNKEEENNLKMIMERKDDDILYEADERSAFQLYTNEQDKDKDNFVREEEINSEVTTNVNEQKREKFDEHKNLKLEIPKNTCIAYSILEEEALVLLENHNYLRCVCLELGEALEKEKERGKKMRQNIHQKEALLFVKEKELEKTSKELETEKKRRKEVEQMVAKEMLTENIREKQSNNTFSDKSENQSFQRIADKTDLEEENLKQNCIEKQFGNDLEAKNITDTSNIT
ncbi:uncharacterized protein MONOS_12076 [Monocercomonoides exilis]|uniref:uncharacterized protein n=1 Tax=Monocercomonoides exilis TaxID=2049356 RepID=UPI00355A1032|nr:hypothetical protein MONOS_12076 [Monocercomonoides exilis]|eukprot:MONOS_12076.1-p1 / transcript=MONOS_12076.1 / gene=MONOS_12076 / organism=Monocercomonoides_exilis_PA203 / gene_product=unspecified product / transcript_product=unspecified product / location=Mono_scaffold00643:10027-12705(+) / protein_length=768 / sequence_SO=supercontig / SO=protein_coding / is_pseudo=false